MTDAIYNEFDIEFRIGRRDRLGRDGSDEAVLCRPGVSWVDCKQCGLSKPSSTRLHARMSSRWRLIAKGSKTTFDCGYTACPVPRGNYLCYEAEVIRFNTFNTLPGDPPSQALGSRMLPGNLIFFAFYGLPAAGNLVFHFPGRRRNRQGLPPAESLSLEYPP